MCMQLLLLSHMQFSACMHTCKKHFSAELSSVKSLTESLACKISTPGVSVAANLMTNIYM